MIVIDFETPVSEWTNEAICQYVAGFMRAQGRRAYNMVKGGCEYRTPQGDRCGVGCLLEDKFNDEGVFRFQGDFIDLSRHYPSIMAQFGIHDPDDSIDGTRTSDPRFDLMLRLQRIHDSAEAWNENGVGSLKQWAYDAFLNAWREYRHA